MTREIKFIVIMGIVSVTFILVHLTFLQGRLTERASRICIGPAETKVWIDFFNVTKAIYDGHINKIEADLASQTEEADYWKESYLWLKKQQEELNNKED